jgi:hypothetical protein
VLDARALEDPLALLEPSAAEIEKTDRWLAECRRKKLAPWIALRDEACDGLGIQRSVAGPAYADAIDTVALMPYAIGFVGDHVGATSLKIVSPPGQGKGQLVLLARALFARLADPLASDMTSAGMLGPNVFDDGAWTQQSGALTRANYGGAALQDVHSIDREANRMRDIVARVLTTGVIESGKSSGAVRGYRVCVIVDANRKHHLSSDGETVGSEFVLVDDTSLDSRFDVIVELLADPSRSWDVGLARLDALIDGRARHRDDAWLREMQIRASVLASRHASVDLKPVRNAIAALHTKLRKSVAAKLPDSPLASDLGARLTTSIVRIVSASARGSDRDAARADDVGVAERLLSRKIDSLALALGERRERAERKRAMRGSQAARSDSARASATRRRQAWLVETYGGRVVGKAGIAAEYLRTSGEQYAVMTLHRDLVAVGAEQLSHGRWKIPAAPTRGRERGPARSGGSGAAKGKPRRRRSDK